MERLLTLYASQPWNFKWIKTRDKIYSDAIRNHSFVPFWKAHLLKPKYDEPKGSNVLMIQCITVQRLPSNFPQESAYQKFTCPQTKFTFPD
jgi:hypothetical protein